MQKKTLILRQQRELGKASDLLVNGGLVVFPTETVYGLGANALDSNAVASIFKAKGRPQDNPLIVHFANILFMKKFGFQVNNLEKKLLSAFSPGPLTLILSRPDVFSDVVSGGLDTVAVRVPSHPMAMKLLELAKIPVAAPSANISGFPSPTNFDMAFRAMNGKADAIIDGGPCKIGLESSVIRVVNDKYIQILRPGGISHDLLREVAGHEVLIETITAPEEAKSSPGTRYPHYKPHAEVRIFNGDFHGQVSAQSVGLLLLQKSAKQAEIFHENFPAQKLQTRFFENIETYAREFYNTLTEMDKLNVELIYCEAVKNEGIGTALMNRMRRAAGLE